MRFATGKPFPFLRCYVTRKVSNGWQLYDPIRNWSWSVDFDEEARVIIV